jgi:hypothetical protein
MSMIRCGECGRTMSDSAAQCPHCGKAQTTTAAVLGLFLGVLVLAIIIASCFLGGCGL